jgi:hypothetical protein
MIAAERDLLPDALRTSDDPEEGVGGAATVDTFPGLHTFGESRTAYGARFNAGGLKRTVLFLSAMNWEIR